MPRPIAPVHVAAGELINAAWGNSVVDVTEWDKTLVRNGLSEYLGRLMMIGDFNNVITDANGRFSVAFAPRAFAGAAPFVFAGLAMDAFPGDVNVHARDVTGFSGRAWSSGTPIANATITIMWGAFGVLAI
jgi:hypothetical protein